MIVEAVDTLFTLGWALAVWIVVGAMVVTAALYAVVTVVVLAWRGARWACRAAWRGRGAPERGSCDSSAAGHAPEPSGGRTEPPHVHDDTHDYREAA